MSLQPDQALPAEKDSLHFRPLSAHFMNSLQKTHAFLYRSAPKVGWQGHVVKFLAKALLVGGYIANIPITLIEMIAFGVLGIVGSIIHSFSGMKGGFFEKFCIKTFASCIQSLVVFSIQCISFTHLVSKKSIFLPRSFTQASLINQISYLGAAAFTNFLLAKAFNGNQHPSVKDWPMQVLKEGVPNAIVEILDAFILDYTPVVINQIDLHEFFNTLPESQQTLLINFDVLRINQTNYLQQFYPIVILFLMQTNIIPNGNNYTLNPLQTEITLNIYSDAEKNYQNHLKDCVKEAIKSMIQDKSVRYLNKNNDFKTGKEMLEMFDSNAAIPLAHLTQIMEIESKEIICPITFNNKELTMYNEPSRYKNLCSARAEWRKMNENDKKLMIEKLLKGGDFEMEDGTVNNLTGWNLLYKKISTLASNIHQGKLMSVLTFSIEDQNFSSINFFGKAWQEAMTES
jgi:hypothetical protein